MRVLSFLHPSFHRLIYPHSAFSWRSTLSNNILNNSPRVEVPGLYADLAFTLLTYAFTLSNLAHATVQSIGAYELDRTITKVQRERKDEQLNVAFGLLCKASGIFSYIADTLLSEWETSGGGGSDAPKLPPDLKQEVLTALSKYADSFLINKVGFTFSQGSHWLMPSHLQFGKGCRRLHSKTTSHRDHLFLALIHRSASLQNCTWSVLRSTDPRRHWQRPEVITSRRKSGNT